MRTRSQPPPTPPRGLLMAGLAGGALLILGWGWRREHDSSLHAESGATVPAAAVGATASALASQPAESEQGATTAPVPAPGLRAAMQLVSARRFHEAAAAAGASPEHERAAALASVFARWAATEPADAAAAALDLTMPGDRDAAWRAAVSTWARHDPSALASCALTSPAPDELRRTALVAAISAWVARDAAAARDWVGRLPSGGESDDLVATVAQQPAFIRAAPEEALSWAEAISEPALRSRVVGRVVREWMDFAPETAAHYARTSPELTPAEREDVLVGERFTPHP